MWVCDLERWNGTCVLCFNYDPCDFDVNEKHCRCKYRISVEDVEVEEEKCVIGRKEKE